MSERLLQLLTYFHVWKVRMLFLWTSDDDTQSRTQTQTHAQAHLNTRMDTHSCSHPAHTLAYLCFSIDWQFYIKIFVQHIFFAHIHTHTNKHTKQTLNPAYFYVRVWAWAHTYARAPLLKSNWPANIVCSHLTCVYICIHIMQIKPTCKYCVPASHVCIYVYIYNVCTCINTYTYNVHTRIYIYIQSIYLHKHI